MIISIVVEKAFEKIQHLFRKLFSFLRKRKVLAKWNGRNISNL